MTNILQRPEWDGHPADLGNAWILRKGERVPRCVLFSHQFGWDLRLMAGELVRSQVCRSADEILATSEDWWIAAVLGRGWR